MKKSIIASLLILCMFTTMLFASCSNTKNNSEIDTTAATDTTAEQVGKNGAVSSYGEEYMHEGYSVPKSLLVNKSIKKIQYLKGIYVGDPSAPEYNTDEVKAERRKTAQRYLDTVGVTDKTEFTVNILNRVAFSVGDYNMEAGENYIGVILPTFPLKYDSTDEEIINVLKSDKYLFALSKLSDIDLDNAYIDREDEGSLEKLEQSDNENGSVSRKFSVCNKADSPEQLAANLRFNSIYFWIFVAKNPEDALKPTIFANWTDKKYIAEANLSSDSYEKAKEQADAEISTKLAENEKVTDLNKATCRIRYDSSVKENYVIPCYQFLYPTNQNRNASVMIPCIDVSALE